MNCKEVETELRDMLARGVPDKMAVILLTVLGCMVGGSGLFDMLSKYMADVAEQSKAYLLHVHEENEWNPLDDFEMPEGNQ